MTVAGGFPTYDAERRLAEAAAEGVVPIPLHGTPSPALPAHVVDAVATTLSRPMAAPPPSGLLTLREAYADELERDLDVIGPVEMVLYAASSARDTDFIVRLCDVYPDGRSIFLTEGIIRARYRGSVEGESVELLEPGEVAEYRIRCYPVANVFRRGHRIRLDVTSSSFPRFSRNLNTGEDVGTDTRLQVAHQTVLHTSAYPSHVVLPVIPT